MGGADAGVVAPNAPEVEGQRDDDHRHRDEIELRGEELRTPQGRESRVGEYAITSRRYRHAQPCCQMRWEIPLVP